MGATRTTGSNDQEPIPSEPADLLQREIEERQARLAATIDELAMRVHPKAVLKSGQEEAQRKAQSALDEAQRKAQSALDEAQRKAQSALDEAQRKAQSALEESQRQAHAALYTDQGDPRVERIAAVVGAAVALVGAIIWRRSRG